MEQLNVNDHEGQLLPLSTWSANGGGADQVGDPRDSLTYTTTWHFRWHYERETERETEKESQ